MRTSSRSAPERPCRDVAASAAQRRSGSGARSKSQGQSGTGAPARSGARAGDRRGRPGPEPEEASPRLLAQGRGAPHGAPLLREPRARPPSADDRFCTQGPVMACPASVRRASATDAAELAFPELITFVDRSVGQASVLLSDRLRLLEQRMKHAPLPEPSRQELCEVAGGVCAAAYHAQKWAHLLRPDELRKPFKPSGCDDADMALALMHHATPRLMVGASEAKRSMSAVLAQHGDKAEARVNKLGVPTADLRALGPHIESLVGRIGRLSNKLRPENMKAFVISYFTPVLGPEPAKRLLLMLGLAASVQAW